MTSITDFKKAYPFLLNHDAKEPFLLDILDEILSYQTQVVKTKSGSLATLESLKKSRNLKIPFTPARNKNIAYIFEILLKNYPNDIKTVTSFEIEINPETKKLVIKEIYEISIQLQREFLQAVQRQRDKKSRNNLLKLLSEIRLFNLSKLVRSVKNKKTLSMLIKKEIGKTIFSYKNYFLDKNNLESSDDYCFHKDNYDLVKKSINMINLKNIIENHEIQINQKLKKFGIYNITITDFRDSKIDYILNVLTEEIHKSLSPHDLIEVKNFQSLRNCFHKVDKLIDPLTKINNDLIEFVKERKICSISDILVIHHDIDETLLNEWILKNQEKIILAETNLEEKYLIYSEFFMQNIIKLKELIIDNNDYFKTIEIQKQQNKNEQFEIFANAGKQILNSNYSMKNIFKAADDKTILQEIIREYEEFQKILQISENIKQESQKKSQKKFSLLGFFKSLFSTKKTIKRTNSQNIIVQTSQTQIAQKKPFSKITQNIYQQIKYDSSPIIPLSQYIEIKPENEQNIDTTIDELRLNNLKIVVPIYNAKENLYPERSKKLLISNVEYLLIDSNIIETPESIRDYTDKLQKERLRGESIPIKAIVSIEKYLLNIHKQKLANLKNSKRKKK